MLRFCRSSLGGRCPKSFSSSCAVLVLATMPAAMGRPLAMSEDARDAKRVAPEGIADAAADASTEKAAGTPSAPMLSALQASVAEVEGVVSSCALGETMGVSGPASRGESWYIQDEERLRGDGNEESEAGH